MNGFDFAPIVFGLASAACWGAGDFCGGLATKSTQVYRVIFSSQVVSLILLVLIALAVSEPVLLLDRFGPPPQVIWVTCGNTSNARLKEILTIVFPKAIQLAQAGESLVEIQ